MLRQRSERGYELLPQKEWIVVNHMIRLKGLNGASRVRLPLGRTARPAPRARVCPSCSRTQTTSSSIHVEQMMHCDPELQLPVGLGSFTFSMCAKKN